MMRGTQFRLRVFGCAAVGAASLLLGAAAVHAQLSEAVIADTRDAVRDAFDPSRAGIVYAASIDFAVQPDIVIRDTASTLDLEINTVHPIGELAGRPMELVTVLGGTSLLGDARGELGFDEFAELGLALQFKLGKRRLLPAAIRIGAKAIIGPDVSGWSLIIGRGI